MRVHQNRELGLAQHVNESRRDDHAVCVNGAFGLGRAQKADGGDASVANADVARIPGRAGAINDVAVADDQVVGGGLSVQRKDKEEEKKGIAEKFGHENTCRISNGARRKARTQLRVLAAKAICVVFYALSVKVAEQSLLTLSSLPIFLIFQF